MSETVSLLEGLVRSAVSQAFGPEHATVDPAVHRSAFADFQADVAMRLARSVKLPPLEVAKRVVQHIDASALCDDVRVSPPGFINFSLSRRYLEQLVSTMLSDTRAGVPVTPQPETVVIDYSGPNVAKEMHVGHLRGTVIGDSVVRLLAFQGHRVIRQNHIGDWGTPFGMLIEHLLDQGAERGVEAIALGELNDFYKAAREKFDSDAAFAERSRQRVVQLQHGDATTLALWNTLVEASKRYFRSIYAKFGVLLEDPDVRGESFYNPLLGDVASELEGRGIARLDEGALCVFLPEFTGREGEPLPLIVRKSDGGFGYAATDLAAVRFRVRELHASRIVYVVGAPQQQHFAMVFATARVAGWLTDSVRAEHLAFGSILGADRKMLRTRSGESVRLLELLDEARDRAEAAIREKNPELPDEVRAEVARQVGMGAIKYADLSTERTKDYVFEWSRMLAFEGNTGPYLQYAHARLCSILRRASDDGVDRAPELESRLLLDRARLQLTEPAERALALELIGFADAVSAAAATLQPHRLCGYMYELATRLSAFYEACPVLKAETSELRDSRLLLCAAARQTLGLGLGLLGMGAPERM